MSADHFHRCLGCNGEFGCNILGVGHDETAEGYCASCEAHCLRFENEQLRKSLGAWKEYAVSVSGTDAHGKYCKCHVFSPNDCPARFDKNIGPAG